MAPSHYLNQCWFTSPYGITRQQRVNPMSTSDYKAYHQNTRYILRYDIGYSSTLQYMIDMIFLFGKFSDNIFRQSVPISKSSSNVHYARHQVGMHIKAASKIMDPRLSWKLCTGNATKEGCWKMKGKKAGNFKAVKLWEHHYGWVCYVIT